MEVLAKEFETKHQNEENTWKNEAKGRKVSMKTVQRKGKIQVCHL